MFFTKRREKELRNTIETVIQNIMNGADSQAMKALQSVQDLAVTKQALVKAQEDLAAVTLKKRVELEELQHHIKLERERTLLDVERKTLNAEKDFQQKEMKLQREYHDKAVNLIEKGNDQLKEMYGEIMKRLPNVSMRIEDNNFTEKTGKK